MDERLRLWPAGTSDTPLCLDGGTECTVRHYIEAAVVGPAVTLGVGGFLIVLGAAVLVGNLVHHYRDNKTRRTCSRGFLIGVRVACALAATCVVAATIAAVANSPTVTSGVHGLMDGVVDAATGFVLQSDGVVGALMAKNETRDYGYRLQQALLGPLSASSWLNETRSEAFRYNQVRSGLVHATAGVAIGLSVLGAIIASLKLRSGIYMLMVPLILFMLAVWVMLAGHMLLAVVARDTCTTVSVILTDPQVTANTVVVSSDPDATRAVLSCVRGHSMDGFEQPLYQAVWESVAVGCATLNRLCSQPGVTCDQTTVHSCNESLTAFTAASQQAYIEPLWYCPDGCGHAAPCECPGWPMQCPNTPAPSGTAAGWTVCGQANRTIDDPSTISPVLRDLAGQVSAALATATAYQDLLRDTLPALFDCRAIGGSIANAHAAVCADAQQGSAALRAAFAVAAASILVTGVLLYISTAHPHADAPPPLPPSEAAVSASSSRPPTPKTVHKTRRISPRGSPRGSPRASPVIPRRGGKRQISLDLQRVQMESVSLFDSSSVEEMDDDSAI